MLKRISVWCLFLLVSLIAAREAQALGDTPAVVFAAAPGAFPLVVAGQAAPVVVSPDDWPGVARAAADLRADVERVSGTLPASATAAAKGSMPVLVGTLGHSALIDGLVRAHKLDVSAVEGKWEAGVTEIVEHPLPGVSRALVIAGSDKRGTIFGLYALSEAMGVSPWYWWADVRVPHHDAVYVANQPYVMQSPAVKYRGIFLNDEAPSLTGWTQEKFGGYNRQFYTKVFELLLRMRANYLWPAMWNNAFNEDDPADPKLADEYGIVMGTSHHEPMLRAQQEWKRHGTGPWDYSTNGAELRDFWTEGIRRNREYESTITVGMRGDGDMAMSATANTALLEKIVADQRKIIDANADPRMKNPQIWALYKEVQEYYEKGMRVPDDVTLLWCDDNWGNIRRLPTAEERKRPGGAGIYYHFDYVGDPRNYKWINTTQITKVWEQMHLALEYGADRVWIVNVGDLKPLEFPIEFFLTYARRPQDWNQNNLQQYTEQWCAREFGPEHAHEIAELISTYTRYNARRKPEQLEPDTYSLTVDHEADRVEQAWQTLQQKAEALAPLLPADEQASYFELVLFPIQAAANVGEMYIADGRNRLFAKEGRATANSYGDLTRAHFAHDAELMNDYNHKLLDGKWDHMMDQTHIGYTSWQQPPLNAMPGAQVVQPLSHGQMAVFVEGVDPFATKLPVFDAVNRQTRTFMIANSGHVPVTFTAHASEPWVHLSQEQGSVGADVTVAVTMDWAHAPTADSTATITVTSGEDRPVKLTVSKLASIAPQPGSFVENADTVAIDAQDFAHTSEADGVSWQVLPGYGATRSAVTSFPVTAPSTLPGAHQACLDYSFTLYTAEKRSVQMVLSPTLPFQPGRGLRYSLAVDSSAPTTVDAWAVNTDAAWRKAVSDNTHKVTTALGELSAGAHTLHVCRVDPGVVIERLYIFAAQPPSTYLGPPESARSLAH